MNNRAAGQLHLDLPRNGVSALLDEALHTAYHRPIVPVTLPAVRLIPACELEDQPVSWKTGLC